jgi:hypothetical protein
VESIKALKAFNIGDISKLVFVRWLWTVVLEAPGWLVDSAMADVKDAADAQPLHGHVDGALLSMESVKFKTGSMSTL